MSAIRLLTRSRPTDRFPPFGPSLVYTNTDDSEKCDIIDHDDENQFAKGQRSRDLRGCSDAKGDLAPTKSGRAEDLKIMNLVILINSAQMFFRNLGLGT
jgi:hypothetical protein